jgi:cellulose synthase/poly-beta-1,6-N-acetylglucosamine synthase-like glycosyltransferase
VVHFPIPLLGEVLLGALGTLRFGRALASRFQLLNKGATISAPIRGTWNTRGLSRRQQPAASAGAPTDTRVSVLVAAWNEAPVIDRFIDSFHALSYPAKELVLCAGGDDSTLGQAQQHESDNVVVLEQYPGEGKQKALRRAFEQAQGDIIFLTDVDCLLSDDVFNRTLAALLQSDEVAVSGSFRPLAQQLHNPWVLYQWAIELFVARHAPEYVQGLMGRNCAVARKELELVGGFEETVPVGTDYYLAKKLCRAGYRIRHVPDSVIETSFPDTLPVYFRKQSRWIRNLLIHGPEFDSWSEVALTLRTMILGIGMLAWPLTFFWTKFWGCALWLAAVSYGLLARVRYVRFSSQFIEQDLGPVYWRLPLYMFVDFIAWARSLLDYLRPDQRKQW